MAEFNLPGLKPFIDDFEKLNKESELMYKNLLNTAVAAEKVANTFKNNDGLTDYVENTRKVKTLDDQIAEAQKKLEKAYDERSVALQKLNFQIAEQNKVNKQVATSELGIAQAMAEARIQQQQETKAVKEAALEKLGLVSAYQKLVKERLDAKKAVMDLIVTQGEEAVATRKAVKEFEALDAKVKQADKAVGDFHRNVGNYPNIGNLANGLKDLVGAFGLTLGITAFANGMRDAFNTIKQFDQAVADLQAITGASGKDLDFLKEKAIELGKNTQGGAVQVVEAYKLIASAKPELLENVDALNQVTEATLVLSKAAGMELPDASKALTDALNQFGAPAEEASVFVDALANGAKYGAAEIPDVTEALLKFGAVARSSNVNIKESTALIELLAENGLKGAEAGTALRNVMLKISAPDALPKRAQEALASMNISMKTLKDNTVPFADKLEMLRPLLQDNAKMVELFGLENVVAAKNIIEHTERLKDLTSKMNEAGTAEEQAAIRMNTLAGKIEMSKARYDSLVLSVNEGSGVISDSFSFIVESANGWLTMLERLNTSWDKLYEKAREEGGKNSKSAFSSYIQQAKERGKTDLEATEAFIRMYERNVNTIEEKIKALKDEEKNTSSIGGFFAGYNTENGRKTLTGLREEIEKQNRVLGEYAKGLEVAKKKLDELKGGGKTNTLAGSTPEEQPTSEVDTSKIDKANEARAKKEQERLKKEYDILISAKKATLDYLMSSYKYEEHLSEDNVAHLQAISLQKQEIAELERKKAMVGIVKGSEDEKLITQKYSAEIQKIKKEELDALAKLELTGKLSDLELYEASNKSKLDSAKKLTDLLVEEENRRLNMLLEAQKNAKRAELGIDSDTTDEKLKIYYETGAELTENEKKYLKWLLAETSKTNKQIEKNNEDLLLSKVKALDEEEERNVSTFKLKRKGSYETTKYELKQQAEKYEKELLLYQDNAEETEKINTKLTENKIQLAEFEKKTKQQALQDGLNALIEFAGRESEVGKAAAIAQTTINTYEGASRALKDYPAPYSYIVAGLTIAQGLANVATISGIQAFEVGTDDAPYTGKAIVDEKGAEIHTDKFGKIKSWGSNSGARLTDIVKGDKIIPADVTSAIKAQMYVDSIRKNDVDSIDYEKLDSIYQKSASKIVTAIKQNRSRVEINTGRYNSGDKGMFSRKTV